MTRLIDRHSGTRKLSVISAVNTHAYLIHPLGSAWYQGFCFIFIKIPIRTQNAEHHPKQNQTKPTNQKRKKKKKKNSLGIETAMLVEEETKQTIYILLALLSSLVFF